MSAITPVIPRLDFTGKVTQARVLLSEWTKFHSLRSTRWSLLAAVVQYRHRADKRARDLYRLPGGDRTKLLDDYFRWLAPLAFMTGVVFAHFFWH